MFLENNSLYLFQEYERRNSQLMRKLHYGIKFPISNVSEENTCLDLNLTRREQVESELLHLLFTPRGQRLRNPNFGTNLIQFIFDPKDEQSWGDVKYELKDIVKRNIAGCTLNDIEIMEGANAYDLMAVIRFTVQEADGSSTTSTIATKLT